MNFDLALEEFRRYLKQNFDSKDTQKTYFEGVKLTLEGKNLDALTQRDLDDIDIGLKERGLASNTIRVRRAAINLFCKTILKRKDLHLKIPWQKPIHKEPIPPEEIERILEVAKVKSKLDYALILVLYDEALRRSEVCNLNVDDVRPKTMELYLRDSKTGNNIIKMTSRVANAIDDYILYERRPEDPQEKAIFVSSRGTRIGEHFVRDHVKDLAVQAGITTRVHPHRFRTSCITHLFNNKINPEIIRKHARHSQLRQTYEYDRPTQTDEADVIERVFVKKDDLNNDDRIKATVDKYIKGEITKFEMQTILDVLRPKQLKNEGELRGYQ